VLDLNTIRGSVQYDIWSQRQIPRARRASCHMARVFVRRRKTRVLARRTGRLSASVFADCALHRTGPGNNVITMQQTLEAGSNTRPFCLSS
jgi:hypothetical protein